MANNSSQPYFYFIDSGEQNLYTIAVAITESSALTIIDVALCFFCLFSLAIEWTVGCSLFKCRSLHPNIRLLMGNLLFCSALTAVGYLGTVVYRGVKVVQYWSGGDRRRLLFSGADCPFGVLSIVGFVANIFAMFFLAVERILATRMYTTYENVKTATFAVVSCSFQWTLTVSLLLYSSSTRNRNTEPDGNELRAHCYLSRFITAGVDLKHMLITNIIPFVFGVGTAALFYVVWRSNRTKIRAVNSITGYLARRFQIKQNINCSLVLARICLFRVAWNLLISLLRSISLIVVASKYDGVTAMVVYVAHTQLLGIGVCVGSLVQSVMLLKCSSALLQYTPKWLKAVMKKSNKVDSEINGNVDTKAAYFKEYEQAWRKPVQTM